jgi:hypothetical protein
MKYQNIIQNSPEWWALKVAKVSGTKFGQLISERKNNLFYVLANEALDGYIQQNDFESEAMQFGNENESVAIDKYELISGLSFARGGVILSDFSNIHMASPDAVNIDNGIIVEVKCTMNGYTQLERLREGVESDKWGQIINYFAVSDTVNEVHWISYCPFRPECEIVAHIVNRETRVKIGTKERTVGEWAILGRERLVSLELDLMVFVNELKTK